MLKKLNTALLSAIVASICIGSAILAPAAQAELAHASKAHSLTQSDDLYLLSLTAIPVTGQTAADAMKSAGFVNIVTEPGGIIRATAISGAGAPKALVNIPLSPEGAGGGNGKPADLNNGPVSFADLQTQGFIGGIGNSCTKNEALTPMEMTTGVQGMASLNDWRDVGLSLETSFGKLNEASVACPHGKADTYQLPMVSSRKEAFHLNKVIHGAFNSVALPGFWPLHGAANIIVVTLVPASSL